MWLLSSELAVLRHARLSAVNVAWVCANTSTPLHCKHSNTCSREQQCEPTPLLHCTASTRTHAAESSSVSQHLYYSTALQTHTPAPTAESSNVSQHLYSTARQTVQRLQQRPAVRNSTTIIIIITKRIFRGKRKKQWKNHSRSEAVKVLILPSILTSKISELLLETSDWSWQHRISHCEFVTIVFTHLRV